MLSVKVGAAESQTHGATYIIILPILKNTKYSRHLIQQTGQRPTSLKKRPDILDIFI